MGSKVSMSVRLMPRRRVRVWLMLKVRLMLRLKLKVRIMGTCRGWG